VKLTPRDNKKSIEGARRYKFGRKIPKETVESGKGDQESLVQRFDFK
jgi:hypothetical protein